MDANKSEIAIVFWLKPDDPYRWRPLRRLVITEAAIQLRSDGSDSERSINWSEIEYSEIVSSRYLSWLAIHFRSGAQENWQPLDAMWPNVALAYTPSEVLLAQRVMSSRLEQGELPVVEPNPYLRSNLRPKNDEAVWDKYRSPQEYLDEGRIPSSFRRLVPLIVFLTISIAGMAALLIWG